MNSWKMRICASEAEKPHTRIDQGRVWVIETFRVCGRLKRTFTAQIPYCLCIV